MTAEGVSQASHAKEQLKIHVLNADEGDSILVEFPQNIWGVVDSNRKHQNAPIPALEFLKRMEKKKRLDKIAFVALTHPHFDHFRGLYHLIEAFKAKIERFWDFGVKVKPIANYFYRIYRDDFEKQRADEFYQLYNLVLSIRTERRKEGKRFYDNCSSFKLMLTLSPNVDVIALSPSGDDQEDYLYKISLYDADELPSEVGSIDHNKISSILLIRFYQHFIILGSDADKETWGLEEEIMKGARALTPLEIQAVCTAFDGKYAVRNRTLFLLCANLGARITEALSLNVGDVFSDGEIVDVLYFRRETVKGKNEGVALTLPSGAKNALNQFISWKAETGESFKKNAPLFLSRQGSRLTRQQAHNIFKEAYKKVGLKGHVTTHSPRKTYAKLVYENSGNDLVVAQRALRHMDIQSTLYYLDTIDDDVTKAMPNFSYGEIDTIWNTSNSKIIAMPKPKEKQAKKKRR